MGISWKFQLKNTHLNVETSFLSWVWASQTEYIEEVSNDFIECAIRASRYGNYVKFLDKVYSLFNFQFPHQ